MTLPSTDGENLRVAFWERGRGYPRHVPADRRREHTTSSPPPTAVAEKVEPMVRQRVRIRFRKQGDLRLVGHRDLMRCLERLFRRAGLALRISEGFHPKPRMSFPSALAVGIEGIDEVMEVELAEDYTADDLRQRLAPNRRRASLSAQLRFCPTAAAKARVRSASYQAPIPAALPSRVVAAGRAFAGFVDVADRTRPMGGRRSTCGRLSWSWRFATAC